MVSSVCIALRSESISRSLRHHSIRENWLHIYSIYSNPSWSTSRCDPRFREKKRSMRLMSFDHFGQWVRLNLLLLLLCNQHIIPTLSKRRRGGTVTLISRAHPRLGSEESKTHIYSYITVITWHFGLVISSGTGSCCQQKWLHAD